MTPILTEPAIDAIRGEYGCAACGLPPSLRGACRPSGVAGPHRDRQAASLIEQLLPGLNAANLGTAAQIAALPERVRGFGRVRQVATAQMHEQASALRKSRDSTSTVAACDPRMAVSCPKRSVTEV